MEDRLLEKKLKETLPQDTEIADVQELVRCLTQQVAHSTATPVLYEPDGDIQEVILTTEVDGVRYILIRSQPRSPHTQVILSPREAEIARMVAKGYPNKTIAAVLDISPWTVCTHLRRTFAKFGVGSRAAMVARLLEEGGHGAKLDFIHLSQFESQLIGIESHILFILKGWLCSPCRSPLAVPLESLHRSFLAPCGSM